MRADWNSSLAVLQLVQNKQNNKKMQKIHANCRKVFPLRASASRQKDEQGIVQRRGSTDSEVPNMEVTTKDLVCIRMA